MANQADLTDYNNASLPGFDYDPNASPKVIPEKLEMVIEGRDPMTLDLTQPKEVVNGTVFTVKEGISYKLALSFRVEDAVVDALRYHHTFVRKGVNLNKKTCMMGSYGPLDKTYVYMTPEDETPKGMIARGNYTVHSKLVDTDQTIHYQFEWGLDITKEWE